MKTGPGGKCSWPDRLLDSYTPSPIHCTIHCYTSTRTPSTLNCFQGLYTVALSTCIHLSGKVFSYLNTYGHDTNIDRNLKNLKLLLFCKSGDVMEQLLWSPLPAALYRWDATRNPFRPQCCPKVLRELHEVHQTSISWRPQLDFSFKFGFEN